MIQIALTSLAQVCLGVIGLARLAHRRKNAFHVRKNEGIVASDQHIVGDLLSLLSGPCGPELVGGFVVRKRILVSGSSYGRRRETVLGFRVPYLSRLTPEALDKVASPAFNGVGTTLPRRR